jgi:hypothetical protein
MGPSDGDITKVTAFLLLVGLIGFVVWLSIRKPKHARERLPASRRPRDVAPTLSDIEPVVEVVGHVESASPALNSPQAQAIERVVDNAPQSNGQDRCRLCKAPVVDFTVVEFEDWQQIEHSWWGRWLAWRERRRPLPHGREFHARRGLCRSCAALGHEADREEEARLASLVAAERRIWERQGRDNAILRRIEHSEFHHAERLDEQRRADARMRSRASEFLKD